MRWRIIIGLVLALGCGLATQASRPAHALDGSKALSQYLERHWTSAHGLPSDVVRALAQTSDGWMWVGTDDGLVRFDGVQFSPPDDVPGRALDGNVAVLHVASDGQLWVGFDDGGPVGPLREGRVQPPTGDDRPRGFARGILQTRDRHWIGTASALLELRRDDQGRFHIVQSTPVSTGLRTLVETREGKILLGTREGLFTLEGQQLRRMEGPVHVRALLVDRQGAIWIGGEGGLLMQGPQGTRTWTTAQGLPEDGVTALLQDRDGNIWIGTNRGLARLEPDGTVARFADTDERSRDRVRVIAEDREGNLWIGTANAGLRQMREEPFTAYTRQQGLPADVVRFVHEAPDGTLWVATDGGVARLVQGRFQRDETPGLPRLPPAGLMVGADGVVWLTTRDGALWRRTPTGYVRFPLPHDHDVLFDAGARRVWVAGEQLHEIVDGQLLLRAPNGTNARFHAAHRAADGRLWFGAYTAVFLLREGALLRHPVVAGGDRSGLITALSSDPDGTLWIATAGGGLKRFQAGKVTTFTIASGLHSNKIFGLIDDGAGTFWLAGNLGISRLSRAQLDEVRLGRARQVSPAFYGVRPAATTDPEAPARPSAWRSRDGRLWFGTQTGLLTLDPGHLPPTSAPPLLLDAVLVDGVPVAPGSTVGESRSGALEIHYRAGTLFAPDRIRFQHRLIGWDEGWVEASSFRVARYVNLPPRTYRFVVRASSTDGRWADVEAQVALIVHPPVYRRWWFLLAAALLAAGLGLGTHRLYVRQLLARQQAILGERIRIARDIHDSLAQGFVAISSQLECAKRKVNVAPDEAAAHLAEAQEAVRLSLADARRSVWSLRTQRARGTLMDVIAELARQISPGEGRAIQVRGVLPPLPANTEENLLRIAQEAMTNAVRHAGGAAVTVDAAVEPGLVRLTVRDEGPGFDPDAAGRTGLHHGLVGMRERAAAIGAKLMIDSRPGAGTTITVTVSTS